MTNGTSIRIVQSTLCSVIFNIVSTLLEWNMPLWCVNLDLKQTFDRIEYVAMFDALRYNKFDQTYIALFAQIYLNQKCHIRELIIFGIERGVKQGDPISPVVFNTAFDFASYRWKQNVNANGCTVSNPD